MASDASLGVFLSYFSLKYFIRVNMSSKTRDSEIKRKNNNYILPPVPLCIMIIFESLNVTGGNQ